jgi:hypothetical protein
MTIIASRFRSLPRLLVLTILTIVASACGGGDDDNACVKTAKTICAAACTCGGSAGCVVGDASSAVTFDNNADCVALYSLGCPGDGSIDFAACQSALATPMCVQSTDGRALDLPPTCE